MALWLLLSWQFVAASSTAVLNPTGSCGVQAGGGAGGRLGYATPGANDVYVPDCNVTLKREYWRVFLQGGKDTAYVIPRPDAMGQRYGFCDSSELGKLFQKYEMCVDSVTDPSTINNMELAEALQITHALHGKLVFVVKGNAIEPFAPEDDILAVCDQNLTRDADCLKHCQALRGRCANGVCLAIVIIPSEVVMTALVPGLNLLYGISGNATGSRRSSAFVSGVASAALIFIAALSLL